MKLKRFYLKKININVIYLKFCKFLVKFDRKKGQKKDAKERPKLKDFMVQKTLL